MEGRSYRVRNTGKNISKVPLSDKVTETVLVPGRYKISVSWLHKVWNIFECLGKNVAMCDIKPITSLTDWGSNRSGNHKLS